ncbi:hypothetical protein PHMEG_00022121 [Phytophthora megakarya]|uniref:Eukaryotic/viral aspartic protease n=1 Tax=Phytophthora megakarya TaxID=4795 RepID=A0A225VL57_9STRA|nr:hypothetical protein PHMEG_00022121 [Phytophthora megakarya]
MRTNAGSTEASHNTARSIDQRSVQRISADRHEADLDQDPDLEEKPRIPLKAVSAVTVDVDENLDPYTTDKDTTKSKSNLSTKPAASTRSYKKKKIKAARTTLKAPNTPDLNYLTGSSHYGSATSEPDSDSPRAPQCMSLGPSGAKYLRSHVSRPDQRLAEPSQTPEKPDRQEKRQIPAGRTTPTTNSTGSSNKLDEYFQMAMDRFLKEQSLATVQPPPLGTQDIDMESVGTPDPDSWEYDPDDLGIPSSSGHTSGRVAVATAAIGSGVRR